MQIPDSLKPYLSHEFKLLKANTPRILTVKNLKHNRILHTPSKPINTHDSSILKLLFNLLYNAVMSAPTQVKMEGVGLSAVQIGILANAFVAHINNQWELFVNPKLSYLGHKTVTDTEGCLSIPNTTVPVTRAYKIKISYITINGNRQRQTLKSFDARVVQHEYDHLQGILITDKQPSTL